ncbi:hypothetical protein VP1G_02924 [Cytospora mali]|uniref:ATP-grasp domain-containing protein n=1 Tax=Cytospora mali TaxID=578113 RepID=A0A194UV18_CYTMA|nr:hypothetical protein VP1G_02924 [Valsa mali var. pyri (nom. inval.)]
MSTREPVVQSSRSIFNSTNGCLRLSLHDHIKTAFLVLLSLITLPISYIIALALTILPPSVMTYLLPFSSSTPTGALYHRNSCRSERDFAQLTVLVTGVGMAKGLTLARSFWLCGHKVIAADFDAQNCSVWTPWHGWVYSRAFDKVYSLRKPVIGEGMDEMEKTEVQIGYIRDICQIVKTEGVDLWVSCSGVASAVEDAMVKEALDKMPTANGARCACIQFDVPTTSTLHDKSTFIRHTRSLKLCVPETYDVTSHSEVLHFLDRAAKKHPARKFILKPVGIDDANRGNMTLLPFSATHDTERHVRRLPITKDKPWILQQFIRGGREYCTHSLVVDGTVKVFAACPSDELLMHYTALANDDPLCEEMLGFTRRFAAAAGTGFTGHLSFDFMAEDDKNGGTSLYAIECNPRTHTAVVLLGQAGGEVRQMVVAYLSAIESNMKLGNKEPKTKNAFSRLVRPPTETTSRYWIGHDFVTLLVLPVWRLLSCDLTVGGITTGVKEFAEHVFCWKDGTFELWDPWPFVALYYHYWPKAIVTSWWKGERWSRLNVSTTKMFSC